MTNLIQVWAPLVVALAPMATLSSAADAAQSRDTITFVAEVSSSEGVVRCGLFNAKGWLTTPLATDVARPGPQNAVCIFRNVAAGTYAISAFHDANNNGELDTNVVGYPVEDYGASRDARNTFSAPSFDDAKFKYVNGAIRLRARLH